MVRQAWPSKAEKLAASDSLARAEYLLGIAAALDRLQELMCTAKDLPAP